MLNAVSTAPNSNKHSHGHWNTEKVHIILGQANCLSSAIFPTLVGSSSSGLGKRPFTPTVTYSFYLEMPGT